MFHDQILSEMQLYYVKCVLCVSKTCSQPDEKPVPQVIRAHTLVYYMNSGHKSQRPVQTGSNCRSLPDTEDPFPAAAAVNRIAGLLGSPEHLQDPGSDDLSGCQKRDSRRIKIIIPGTDPSHCLIDRY